jgi:hypothetical protein
MLMGNRFLPENIALLLTPRALAYWRATLAGITKKTRFYSKVISTNSFTVEEVDQLRSILLSKLKINSTRILFDRAT